MFGPSSRFVSLAARLATNFAIAEHHTTGFWNWLSHPEHDQASRNNQPRENKQQFKCFQRNCPALFPPLSPPLIHCPNHPTDGAPKTVRHPMGPTLASQQGFAVRYDLHSPLTTPRGLRDPHQAAQQLDEAAQETMKLFDALDVPWGQVMRYQYCGARYPGQWWVWQSGDLPSHYLRAIARENALANPPTAKPTSQPSNSATRSRRGCC